MPGSRTSRLTRVHWILPGTTGGHNHSMPNYGLACHAASYSRRQLDAVADIARVDCRFCLRAYSISARAANQLAIPDWLFARTWDKFARTWYWIGFLEDCRRRFRLNIFAQASWDD